MADDRPRRRSSSAAAIEIVGETYDPGNLYRSHGTPPDSWLFEKGETSVRIVRTGPMMLEVLGPGPSREGHAFTLATELVAFLERTGEDLTAFGYRRCGYGAERRSAKRTSPLSDRRHRS